MRYIHSSLFLALLLGGCSQSVDNYSGHDLLIESGLYSLHFSGTEEATGQSSVWAEYEVLVTRAEGTDTLGDLTDLVRLDGKRVGTDAQSSTWYQFRSSGVYGVAYSNPASEGGQAHPDLAMRPSDHFQAAWDEARWSHVAAVPSGEPIYYDEPRHLYPYRLRIGEQWVEFELDSLRRLSRVDRIEDVTVAVGTYTAYVIVSDLEFNQQLPGEKLQISAYVVPGQGMVLREVEGRFMGYDENGEPEGWFSTLERVELIDG